MMLMEKAKGVPRGAGYEIKAGGGVLRPPPQCGRRKKRIGTQIIDADGKSKRNRSR